MEGKRLNSGAATRQAWQEASQNTVHSGAGQEPQRGSVRDFLPERPRTRREGLTLSEHLEQLPTENAHILDGLSPVDRYAQAVNDSLDQPVISIDSMVGTVGSDAAALSEKYPGGFLTPRQYMEERGLGLDSDDVGGVLAGTLRTNDENIRGMAEEVRAIVQANSPEGQFAKLGGRPDQEQQALEAQYGSDARFFLTPEGEQNHKALRVAELWRATGEDYIPASGMSQALRAVGGVTGPLWNIATGRPNEHIGQPWDEAATVASPDGKYRYAVDMYGRANLDANRFPSGHASVFTPSGLPRYTKYDGVEGFNQFASRNQDFAPAYVKQYATQTVADIGNRLGNWLAGGDPNYANNASEIRTAYNRTVPRVPDGMAPADVQAIGSDLRQADDERSGYNSALLGPAVADAYNATIGNAFNSPMQRTYLSPAANTLVGLPEEMVTDFGNIATNFAAGPILGGLYSAATSLPRQAAMQAAKAGGQHMIRSLIAAPTRFADDTIGEAAEDVPTHKALGGSVSSYLQPERDNMLMGDENPNASGYWQKFEDKDVESRTRAFDAAARWGALKNRSPISSPVSRP